MIGEKLIKNDKLERRKLERRRAKSLGMSSHTRAMHECYEDFGYYFMLLLMNMFEFLFKGVEKKTGMLNQYEQHRKRGKPTITPSGLSPKKVLDSDETAAPKAGLKQNNSRKPG